MIIVDRTEGNIVVCEADDKKMIEIDIKEFEVPPEDGDIVEFIDNKYRVNKQKTEERKYDIDKRFFDLFE